MVTANGTSAESSQGSSRTIPALKAASRISASATVAVRTQWLPRVPMDLFYRPIARMPKHPDHPRENMAAGETLGISPNSKHPWEAWLWIRFLMQYDEQLAFATAGWTFPAHKAALLDMDMSDPMNEAFWLDAQNNEYAKMWYHKAGDIDGLLGQMVQEALLTHSEAGFDLQALLDQYAEEATAILQED